MLTFQNRGLSDIELRSSSPVEITEETPASPASTDEITLTSRQKGLIYFNSDGTELYRLIDLALNDIDKIYNEISMRTSADKMNDLKNIIQSLSENEIFNVFDEVETLIANYNKKSPEQYHEALQRTKEILISLKSEIKRLKEGESSQEDETAASPVVSKSQGSRVKGQGSELAVIETAKAPEEPESRVTVKNDQERGASSPVTSTKVSDITLERNKRGKKQTILGPQTARSIAQRVERFKVKQEQIDRDLNGIEVGRLQRELQELEEEVRAIVPSIANEIFRIVKEMRSNLIAVNASYESEDFDMVQHEKLINETSTLEIELDSIIFGKSAEEASGSSSPVTKEVGGINLNPALMDLQIKRDGNGIPLPFNLQPATIMDIEGLLPVIINVTPVMNVPLLLGFDMPRDEKPYDSADSDPSTTMELGYIDKYRNKYVRGYIDKNVNV